LANSLELSAQLMIHTFNWKEASHLLSEGEKLLQKGMGIDSFLLCKWRTILNLKKSKTKNTPELKLLRVEAVRVKHWETVRYCDFVEAVVTQNHDLIHRVYFGTPFVSFRGKILLEFGMPLNVPEKYIWRMNSETKTKE